MEHLLDFPGLRALLLFFTLFVVRAAADCPKPQEREDIVLTVEALLMNDFPEGTDVIFECAKGYVQDGGSGITTCTNDTWTEPDLVCKKRDCGPPEPQKHMRFNTSAGTLFGSIIRVYCDKGYQISGMSYKQCYVSGWIGRTKCEIITCDKPPRVAYGRSSWDTPNDPKYGQTIQYTCIRGFILTGPDTIMCSENGEYDSRPPECKGWTSKDVLLQTPTFPAREAPTSTELSATPTAHRDKTVTSATAPVTSPSQRGAKDILTTEDKAATTSVPSTTTSSLQGAKDIFTTEDKAATTSVPSTTTSSLQGAKDIFTTEDKAATTSVTSTTTSSLQGKPNKTEVSNSNVDYIPVIVSVICVSLVACMIAFFLHKYLLRRKGSANGMMPLC